MLNDSEKVATENTEPKVMIKRDMTIHRRVSIRICRNCGESYVLTDNDAIYYVNKFGTLPLSCPKCREKHRITEVNKDVKAE